MAGPSTYNILMYSHDTYGLGHIRRTMSIASQLRQPNINILILTGSPIAGRFTFSSQVDFVRIPGMIKHTNEEYRPLSIKIDARQALNIRKNIITATAKTFRPDLFIVDKEPLGLKKEVLPTLEWLKKYLPQSRSILGLRDVMDDSVVVRRDWEKKGIYRILGKLYDEIWVYGNQDLYDAVRRIRRGRYRQPISLFSPGTFPARCRTPVEVARLKQNALTVRSNGKLVLVTTGGGGDGYAVMDAYMYMLEIRFPGPGVLRVFWCPDRLCPRTCDLQISDRAKRLGVKFYQFYRRMEKLHCGGGCGHQHGWDTTRCVKS